MRNQTAANLSSFQLNLIFSPEKIYIDRYMSLPWFMIGFIGNLISFLIWTDTKMRRENSSAVYLAALSINDFLVLACVLILDLQYAWNMHVLKYCFCQIFMVLSTATQLFSPVLVLAFTIERWIAICYPFKRHSLCTPKKAVLVSGLLFLFVLLYNTLNGFMWTYKADIDSCVFQSIITNESTIETHYIWCSEIVFSGCVPFLILMFNIMVIKEMYRISNGQCYKATERLICDNKEMVKSKSQNLNADRSFLFTTIMLLSVSFYLFFTSLPVGVMFALQQVITLPNEHLQFSEIATDPLWKSYFRMNVMKTVIDEICTSHYALNIVIYLLTGQAFRSHFFEKLTKLISIFRTVDLSVNNNESLYLNRSEWGAESCVSGNKLYDHSNIRRNRMVTTTCSQVI